MPTKDDLVVFLEWVAALPSSRGPSGLRLVLVVMWADGRLEGRSHLRHPQRTEA